MRVVAEFDYRNASGVIGAVAPSLLTRIRDVLNAAEHSLDISTVDGKSRTLSSQVQQWFVAAGWKAEVAAVAVPGMRYDLHDSQIPIEIELGHERLVYPDFFEFLADYSAQHIPAAIMIVTHTPKLFGHSWHCSLASTTRKIQAISSVYLVPTLVIGVDP